MKDESEEKKGLTRRDFLKSTGGAAAVAGSGSVANDFV